MCVYTTTLETIMCALRTTKIKQKKGFSLSDWQLLQSKAKFNSEDENSVYDTSIGRILFNDILPEGMPFDLINTTLDSKQISSLIDTCYRKAGLKRTVIFADRLMYIGYEFSTKSGSSIGIDDFVIPEDKERIVSEAEKEVKDIESQFASGLVTKGEKYNKAIDIWTRANEMIAIRFFAIHHLIFCR